MQDKMKHLIAAAALAAFAASGSALAQGGAPNPSDTAASVKDKVNDAKSDAKNKSKGSSDKTTPPGAPNNPITVTPPSADNSNTTSVGVDTPKADANASAGPKGANADVNVDANTSSGKNPAKPVTDKLAKKKDEKKQ